MPSVTKKMIKELPWPISKCYDGGAAIELRVSSCPDLIEEELAAKLSRRNVNVCIEMGDTDLKKWSSLAKCLKITKKSPKISSKVAYCLQNI